MARRSNLAQVRASRHPQLVRAGVYRLLTIAPPFPERRGVDRVTRRLVQRSIRRALADMGRWPAALVSTSVHPRLDFISGVRRVYYATDDFGAGASLMGEQRERVERLERSRLDEADVVGAVSSLILSRWGIAEKQTFVLPNGADVERCAAADYAQTPPDVDLPGPVAGVIGQLSERIDIGLLEAVADRGVDLLLVGPRIGTWQGDRFVSLTRRPNVAWVGAKPLDDLPSYLGIIDVGLTPYVDSEFNRASYPLKTLEYLAAGCRVVSTPLPAVDSLNTDLVTTARSASAFGDAVVACARQQSSSQDVALRRRFAEQHSWSSRARAFASILRLETESASDGVEVVDGSEPA